MKKKSSLLLLASLFLGNTLLLAVPAKNIQKTFIQPDGSKVTIVLQGDEKFHYYSTTDGIMLKEDANGSMKYAVISPEGELIAGKYIAKEPDVRGTVEQQYINHIKKENFKTSIAKQREKSPIERAPGAIGSSQFPNKGEVRGLIILAEYQDQRFSEVGTKEELTNLMNQKGYSSYGAVGSAKDYFMDQSSNQFIPTFDVVGPVLLPKDMAYYGANSSYTNFDIRPWEMVVDACKIANQEFGVDFSQYDLDEDGKVDLVYVIYAGYGEAQGGSENTIWPHASDVSNYQLSLNGKKVVSYACSSELRGSEGAILDGVGTFCHEFSHCLGLPDIYDSEYSGGFAMGRWSIMDSGCYNNESRTPAGYSAFERYSVGWLERKELTPGQGIQLKPLNKANEAYFITSDVNKDEYYTIENRQQTGWDAYLPGHGMMILHIDYKENAWISNQVTRKDKERIQIVPADGVLNEYTLHDDAFPGEVNNNSFTDVSEPAATLKTGGFLGKPITEIAEKDGIITFNYMDRIAVPPTASSASEISKTGFKANWTSVKDVDSYILEVAPYTTGEVMVSENFAKFTEGTNAIPDGTDIGGSLDSYMQSEGWVGSNIRQAGGMCLMVSNGELKSPIVSLSNNTTFTLSIEVMTDRNTTAGLEVTLINASNERIIENKSFKTSSTMKKCTWNFTTDASDLYLRINANYNLKIQGINLYTGDVKSVIDNGETPVSDGVGIFEKRIIPDITETSYVINNLPEGEKYLYNIRTKVEDMISIASNKISVVTANNIIENASASENHIYVSGNMINVLTAERNKVDIYSIDGILSRSFIAKDNHHNIEIPNGIYIIRINGTTAAKVAVAGK